MLILTVNLLLIPKPNPDQYWRAYNPAKCRVFNENLSYLQTFFNKNQPESNKTRNGPSITVFQNKNPHAKYIESLFVYE